VKWTLLKDYLSLLAYVTMYFGIWLPATVWSWSQSHITTDSQSRCQVSIWDPRPIFISPWNGL
jgi:hypothetical protein